MKFLRRREEGKGGKGGEGDARGAGESDLNVGYAAAPRRCEFRVCRFPANGSETAARLALGLPFGALVMSPGERGRRAFRSNLSRKTYSAPESEGVAERGTR